MQYYKTSGVCARQIGIEVLNDGTIDKVEFCGGCDGNTHGLSKLLVGMKKDEVIKRLEGITCGSKPTSCPDQLAQILKSL